MSNFIGLSAQSYPLLHSCIRSEGALRAKQPPDSLTIIFLYRNRITDRRSRSFALRFGISPDTTGPSEQTSIPADHERTKARANRGFMHEQLCDETSSRVRVRRSTARTRVNDHRELEFTHRVFSYKRKSVWASGFCLRNSLSFGQDCVASGARESHYLPGDYATLLGESASPGTAVRNS